MKKILSFSLLLIVLFLLYLWLPVASLATVTLYFLPLQAGIKSLVDLALAGLTAYFFNVFLWALIEKRIAKANVIAFYLLYFAFAVSTLLLRGTGSWGWNFNLLNIFTTGQFVSLVTLLNLMLFIPVGFLLKLSWRNLAIMAVIIALVEMTQALTHQGFCDVDDWLLNMISFVAGTLLARRAQFVKVK
ncbi:MAG: VanZ family protein [Streptococcaceae bacterium]|jgi:hypothetical protein|nr:VanZ family protein [Streptococcaceae bacterium]